LLQGHSEMDVFRIATALMAYNDGYMFLLPFVYIGRESM